jgi:hypothetical protein
MEKPNILNTLNILKKVEMGENSTILLYFGNIPNWNQNDFSYNIGESVDHYEVVEVNFDLEYSDKVDLYWKIHRYIGERSFITVENNFISLWRGEITDYEEQWNYFDDLDDEILILNYKKYNVEKTMQDWKTDYMKLEKRYYSLLIEKMQ